MRISRFEGASTHKSRPPKQVLFGHRMSDPNAAAATVDSQVGLIRPAWEPAVAAAPFVSVAYAQPRPGNLAVLKAKIKIKIFRNRAGIGPKPMISLGKWQSGPSPGTPRAKDKN